MGFDSSIRWTVRESPGVVRDAVEEHSIWCASEYFSRGAGGIYSNIS